MDRRIAWMFPGQGAQYCRMGRGLIFDEPPASAVFRETEALSELPLLELSEEGGAAELRNPAILEPLLACFSILYADRPFESGLRSAVVAGYGAGAIAAMYCAEVLNRCGALAIAVARGCILARAKNACVGAMSILCGMPVLGLVRLIDECSGRALAIAYWNAPDHIAIVGRNDGIDQGVTAVRAAGGQTFPVDVVGAWPCPVAEPIAREVAVKLEGFRFNRREIPYYCSAIGDLERDPQRLRESVAQQIHRPVSWQAAVSNLVAREGVKNFFEVGCGRTLRGMTGRIFAGRPKRIDFINLHDLREYEYAA